MSTSLSYWHTPGEHPLEFITVPGMIDHWASHTPEKEAYVVRMSGVERSALTFQELKEKTEKVAAGFLQLGLVSGDYALITGMSCTNWLIADLACQSIGVRTVRCLTSILSKDGLLSIINGHGIKALIYHPGEAGELHDHLLNCLPELFQDPVSPSSNLSIRHVISMSSNHTPPHITNIDDLLKATHDDEAMTRMQAARQATQPDDIATVFMSSGSTGFPKAIPYTHFRLLNVMRQLRLFRQMAESGDRFFVERSMAWIGSFGFLPLAYGMCNVYVHPLLKAQDNQVDFAIKVSEWMNECMNKQEHSENLKYL